MPSFQTCLKTDPFPALLIEGLKFWKFFWTIKTRQGDLHHFFGEFLYRLLAMAERCIHLLASAFPIFLIFSFPIIWIRVLKIVSTVI